MTYALASWQTWLPTLTLVIATITLWLPDEDEGDQ
jgi:hypothetical protein